FLRSLDVFVFPSSAESFGLASVEAAQAGVPVVANDLEVLREVLAVDGQPCAVFVDVTNTWKFTEAPRKLLTDQQLRRLLSSRGIRLGDRYSRDAMVDRFDALISSCG